MTNNIKIYTKIKQGEQWLQKYQGCVPLFGCILGFTATGLIEGISAAGATPEARKYTALADAEFLINGVNRKLTPKYPLPPLTVGASPVFISRAVVQGFELPIYLFNAGLPQPPNVPCLDLGGIPANCLTTGKALPLNMVHHLYQQGLAWGEKLADLANRSYLILGECVVGGTTTALALLTGLGISAQDKVNSSHPRCNHKQKWSLVQEGLINAGLYSLIGSVNPFELISAIGDPMQIFVAAIAISASQKVGVMLAGGTQMLAVYALIQALTGQQQWNENIVVGTTRWVAEDPTGDTLGLARNIGSVPLLGTALSFAQSPYPNLRCYERGYVKEGVGAGGCAIASHLLGWNHEDLLNAIENIFCLYQENLNYDLPINHQSSIAYPS
jgi:uncharacterized protein (TIGR00303 family)